MLLASMIVGIAMADSSTDKQECTEQLTGLATCLPYIQGESKAPPPDCCSGLKQVLKQNKKCLCLIIKDRNDPDLGGLMITVTSALSLPTVCNAPANISKCPGNIFFVAIQFGSASLSSESILACRSLSQKLLPRIDFDFKISCRMISKHTLRV